MKTNTKSIYIVLGTRPEIIKLSPVIRECIARGSDFSIVHTGQHYTHSMDAIFFDDLDLPQPTHNIEVGSGTHGMQTGVMLERLEKIFMKEKPDIVVVHGDTNSTLAGALAASKLHIPVAHVESGLRSYDKKMPEEINRVLVDHISRWLLVPTPISLEQVKREGIQHDGTIVTGNTIVDALTQNMEIAKRKSSIMDDLALSTRGYVLVTAHRPENTDDEKCMTEIVQGLLRVSRKIDKRILWTLHPRTLKVLKQYNLYDVLAAEKKIMLKEPFGFLDFLTLEANAALIITDSGGLQEEGCILGVPCVTLRNNTERPESVGVGANILSGAHAEKIEKSTLDMLSKSRTWVSPFGDGQSAKRILDVLLNTTQVDEGKHGYLAKDASSRKNLSLTPPR